MGIEKSIIEENLKLKLENIKLQEKIEHFTNRFEKLLEELKSEDGFTNPRVPIVLSGDIDKV